MAVVSKELLRKLKAAEHAYNKRLLSTWASLDGNPRGAGYLETDWGTIFFSAANSRNSIFNHAGSLADGMLEALDDIEAAYDERGIPSTVETTACELSDNLRECHFAAMLARGYQPHLIEGLYYAEADKVFTPASNDVEIARVSGEAATAEFLELYLAGWEYPEDIAQIWRGIGSKMQADPNYTAFIARVGGEPAGCAQLYVHDGIAYLADAVVLPKFRRLGCQRALFAARRDVAIERGSDLIFSIAEIAGQSAKNMESFGMRLATELWHWRKDAS